MHPGEVIVADEPIVLNAGRATKQLMVTNLGDRPVQVGSHFHFFEVNRCLSFDRAEAFGFRLDVPSGTSVRFEPGEEKRVNLVEMGGTKTVYGLNDLTRGRTVERNEGASLEKARRRGFLEYVEGPATGFAPGWDEGAVTGEADEETGKADASQPAACGCAGVASCGCDAGESDVCGCEANEPTSCGCGTDASTCSCDTKEA